MSDTTGRAPTLGGLPARTVAGIAGSTGTASGTPTVPANATGPVWQPWMDTHAKAQSALKTQINAALVGFSQEMTAAQRLLDAGETIANQQAKPLEQAAWAAWHRYMQAASSAREAVMSTALDAYQTAIAQAQARSDALIANAEDSYKRARSLSEWGRNQATGSDTF